jgi:GABA(A) receptor-associated protein
MYKLKEIYSSNEIYDFKENISFDKRKAESINIINKYPNRIPIIVEINKKYKKNLLLDKRKYLVPGDLNIGQFLYVIRKRMLLEPNKALFMFVNNSIPPTSNTIHMVYDTHKDADGFLYFTVSLENTFG